MSIGEQHIIGIKNSSITEITKLFTKDAYFYFAKRSMTLVALSLKYRHYRTRFVISAVIIMATISWTITQ